MLRSLSIKVALLAVVVFLVGKVFWPAEGDRELDESRPVQVESPVGHVSASAEPPTPGRSSGQGPESGRRLDLNRATEQELQRLPGIGPVLAQRIIGWRKAHGPFQDVEALAAVPGIGPKRMARLRPLVGVGRATSRKVAAQGG